jgi:hypothetical protein
MQGGDTTPPRLSTTGDPPAMPRLPRRFVRTAHRIAHTPRRITRNPRRIARRPAPFSGLTAVALLVTPGCEPAADPGTASLDLPLWSAQEVARIGSVDGEITLGTGVRVAVGPEGHLYLTESGSHAIRVFTPAGEPVRTIGREGEGPGEFAGRPEELTWAGDTLLVWDGRRVSRFDAEGRFLRGERAPTVEMPGGVPVRVYLPLADGEFVGSTPSTAGVAASADPTVAHLRLTAEGRIVDTLFTRDIGRSSRRLSLGGVSPQPFFAAPPVHIERERRSVLRVDWSEGEHPLLQVTRTSFEGDTLLRAEIPYRPVPLTDEDVEEVLASFAEAFQRSRGLSESEAWALAWEGLYRPEHRPGAVGVLPAEDGGIWVQVWPGALGATGDRTSPGRLWLVLDAEGRPEGLVEVPAGFFVYRPDREGAWGMLRDDLGVNYVVRVEVLRADGAP